MTRHQCSLCFVPVLHVKHHMMPRPEPAAGTMTLCCDCTHPDKICPMDREPDYFKEEPGASDASVEEE